MTYADPPAYFEEALVDAERLLTYASEIGMQVDAGVRNSILEARAAGTAQWDEGTAANLLTALGTLAGQLKPVTAESLKVCSTRPRIPKYWVVSIWLAAFIVPFSVA